MGAFERIFHKELAMAALKGYIEGYVEGFLEGYAEEHPKESQFLREYLVKSGMSPEVFYKYIKNIKRGDT